MAYVLPQDRVRETSTTTGTGALTLTATSDFRRFSAVASVGDTVDYVIVLGPAWEVGIGTVGASNTLARTIVKASSNAGAAVSFAAGVKDVFMGAGAHVLASFASTTSTTEATGAGTTAAALFAGGVEIAKKLFVTGAVVFNSTLGVGTTTPQKTFVVSDGGNQGIELAPQESGQSRILAYNRGTSAYAPLYIEGSTITLVNGTVAVSNTTASTSPSTGALVVAGGAGFAGSIFGGSVLNAFGPSGTTGNAELRLRGGSGATYGPFITFYKNTTGQWSIGSISAITVSGTSDDLGIQSGIGVALRISASTNALSLGSTAVTSSASTGSLVTSGGIGAAGVIWAGGNIVTNASMGVGTGVLYKQFQVSNAGAAGFEISTNDGTFAGHVRMLAYNRTSAAYVITYLETVALRMVDSAGSPTVDFQRAGVIAGAVIAGGAGMYVMSNAAQTAGMYIAYGASSWTAVSDGRTKDQVETLDVRAMLYSNRDFRAVRYRNKLTNRIEIGGIAQENAGILPEVVQRGSDDDSTTFESMTDDGIWAMSYDRHGIVALHGVGQAFSEIDELKAEVDRLQDRIQLLEAA